MRPCTPNLVSATSLRYISSNFLKTMKVYLFWYDDVLVHLDSLFDYHSSNNSRFGLRIPYRDTYDATPQYEDQNVSKAD